jgi:hypothetical protein
MRLTNKGDVYMQLKKWIKAKAIEVTSLFEGGGYGSISGNFDGQYLSFGFLQWNLGMGTLQPQLRRLFHDYPALAQSILPNGGKDLLAALNAGKEKEWALTIQTANWVVIDPWLSALRALAKTPEYRLIQDDAAIEYINQGLNLCTKYDLNTDRGFALCFDIAVQNWGPRASFVMPTGLDYMGRMKALVDDVVSKSNTRWQSDVRSRKMAIVNGSGTVHGIARTFVFYDTPMYQDDVMRPSVDKLVQAKIISSPDYWMEYADKNYPCKGEYMAAMIMKATNTTTLQNGVYILVNRGIVRDSTYWLQNATSGRTVLGEYAKVVIYGLASKTLPLN